MKTKAECPLFLVVAAVLCGCCGGAVPPSDAPWGGDRPFRVSLTVDAGSQPRTDVPLIVELADVVPVAESFQVVEVDSAGEVLPSSTVTQVDSSNDGSAALTILLSGPTDPGNPRHFLAYFAKEGTFPKRDAERGIRTRSGAKHMGHDAIQIETPSGKWIYHTQGAGFASLTDTGGNEWLGYSPGGGSAGEYRGMPNLVHPEGYFHAGGSECETRVAAKGRLRVRLESSCGGGKWVARWDVFDRFARMTVLRADHPFWFLYEGTPGGKLDAEDFVGRSDGRRFPAGDSWSDDLPGPEWVYFGDPSLTRVLWLAHSEDDKHPDSYYEMDGEMTVFGFGRRRLERFLTETPATFSVGFAEFTDHATVAEIVASATAPVNVQIGPVEIR